MGYSQRKQRQLTELHRRARRDLLRGVLLVGVVLGGLMLTTPRSGSPANPTLDSRVTYTYDNLGNRLTAEIIQQGITRRHTYTYDNLSQLTAVAGSQTHAYTYDPVGNRLSADGTVYTPNPLNQYSTVGGTNLTYDASGNLTSDGVRTYDYDDEHRLIRVTGPGVTVEYAFDPFGRLIEKNENGALIRYLYDGDQIIEEGNAANQVVATYIYGPGINELLTMTRGGQTYYFFLDGLGSVMEITNTAGEVVESYTYDPYGQPTPVVSTIGNPFRFTGHLYDATTELYHLRARAYHAKLGRFLQRDPQPVEPNPYSYALNNPTTLVDVQGNLSIIPGVPPVTHQDPRAVLGAQLPAGQVPTPPRPPRGWVPPLPAPPGPDLLPTPPPGTEAGQKERTGKRGAALPPGVGQAVGVNLAKGASPEGKSKRGRKKQDIKQVDDVAKQFGMDPETRSAFGRYVEDTKEGRDPSFKELVQKALEFLGRR